MIYFSVFPMQMALSGSSSEALARTKTEYEAFLGDAAKLKEVRERMKVSQFLMSLSLSGGSCFEQ
jgi:hypothetical protein